MATPVELFNYDLPAESIAQTPVEPRDHSRLLVLDRKTGEREHKQFFEIIDELKAGDLLVMNDTKVFKARLQAKVLKDGIGGLGGSKLVAIEMFLLRGEGKIWETLMNPGKKVAVGDKIVVDDAAGIVREKKDDGVVIVEFDRDREAMMKFADEHGAVPLPPYIDSTAGEKLYQTVYAKHVGSVAAPTAGFHFTPELIEKLKVKGVEFAYVTLHVGLGTFRPMKTETIEEHEMHKEFVEISRETAAKIAAAKKEGRRVIAVGTTTTRALESTGGQPHLGDVNMFITPGYKFKVIDGLITNFHLPKSTLLVLVSSFAGREHVIDAYKEAIKLGYRFYSFGDAMFIG